MTLTDEQVLIASVSAFRLSTFLPDIIEGLWNLDSFNITSKVESFESDAEDGAFDAGFIAETDDEIIVSLRGVALPMINAGIKSVIQDWQNAVERNLIPHPSMPGKIHKGFWDSILNLEDENIFKSIVQRLASNKRLVITGYSKGGALAPLAASHLIGEYDVDPSRIRLCFFSAPKCGDTEFATNLSTTLHNIVRYETQYDLIPHFPYDDQFLEIVAPSIPRAARRILFTQNDPKSKQYIPGSNEYQAIGQLMFVDADNRLIKNLGPNFQEQRYQQLAQKIKPIITISVFAPLILSRHSPLDIQEALKA